MNFWRVGDYGNWYEKGMMFVVFIDDERWGVDLCSCDVS